MEPVFCDFTKLPDDAGKYFSNSIINNLILIIYKKFFRISIGSDVKSTLFISIRPTGKLEIIPFDSAQVNEGNYAMNLASGIFTAPRTGTYYFAFTANVVYPFSSKLSLSLSLHHFTHFTGFILDEQIVASL